jgi:hypothetical protein
VASGCTASCTASRAASCTAGCTATCTATVGAWLAALHARYAMALIQVRRPVASQERIRSCWPYIGRKSCLLDGRQHSRLHRWVHRCFVFVFVETR